MVLTGEGRDGADIRVRLSFQTHVFSIDDTGNCGVHRLKDEGDNLREFCPDRYKLSLDLPQVCQSMIEDNFLTWESKDKNRVSNLAVTQNPLKSGPNYLIVYYIFPSRTDRFESEVVVKSAYMRDIDFSKIKRKFKVKQLIKTSYYEDRNVP